MIPLSITKKNDFVKLEYNNEADYFKIRDEIDDEFEKHVGVVRDIRNSEFYKTEVVRPAHRIYMNSLEYSLFQLLNHLKAIVQKYGDYLIVDYCFNGVRLIDNDEHMSHCVIDSDDEEFEDSSFNCHLCGKPFREFVEVLSRQKTLGDIRVKSLNVVLLDIKTTKAKRKRTHIPRGLKHEVFKRDGYKCVECGASRDDGATLHVDHKIPVSKGGTDELDNLQTLCQDCNLNKSDVIQ